MAMVNTSLPDRIRVGSPCNARWEDMRGDDRIRFCDQCQLNVYNFSELSPGEIESLVANKEGRLCARLYRRVDGTLLTKDCPVGLRAVRLRVSKRVAAVFAAVAAFTSATVGQQRPERKTPPQEAGVKVKVSKDPAAPQVVGTVKDLAGAPVAGAEVLVEATGFAGLNAKTDEDGKFQINQLPDGSYVLSVQSPGFNIYKARLKVARNWITTLDIVLSVGMMGDVVIVAPEPHLETQRSTTIIPGDIGRKLPIQ